MPGTTDPSLTFPHKFVSSFRAQELSLLARLKSPDVLSFVGIAASPGAAPTFDMDDDIEDREVFFLFEFAAGGDVYTLLRKDVRLGIRFRIQVLPAAPLSPLVSETL